MVPILPNCLFYFLFNCADFAKLFVLFFIQLIFISRCQRRKHWMQEKLTFSTMPQKRKHVVTKRFAPQADNTTLLQQLSQDKGYRWNVPSHISGKKKTGWEFLTKPRISKKRNSKQRYQKQEVSPSPISVKKSKRVVQTPEDVLLAIGLTVKPHLLKCLMKAQRQPVHELSHVHRNHLSQLAGPAVEVVLKSFAGKHWFVFVHSLIHSYVIIYVDDCACIFSGDHYFTTSAITCSSTTATATTPTPSPEWKNTAIWCTKRH